MKIKTRTRYRTGRGTIEAIHSATREYPDWVSADGRFIIYIKDFDEHNHCTSGRNQRLILGLNKMSSYDFEFLLFISDPDFRRCFNRLAILDFQQVFEHLRGFADDPRVK